MIGAVSRSVSRSLRWRFLLVMVLGGIITAGAASWFTYRAVTEKLEDQIEQRARLLASAINHAAMVSPSRSALQHVIEAVIDDEREVEAIIVAAGLSADSPEILAAHDRDRTIGRHDRTLDAHAWEEIKAAIGEERFGQHYHPETGNFGFLAPLGPRISAPDGHTARSGASGARQGRGSEAKPGHELASGQGMARKHGDQGAMPAGDGSGNWAKPKEFRGAILLKLNRSGVDWAIATISLRVLINLLVAIAVTAILAYSLLRRQVLAPIGAIHGAMSRRKRGDRTAFAPSLSADEIGDVGRTFNEMLDAMDRHRTQLSESAAALASALNQAETANERLRDEIAERERAQEALVAARDQAELANRAKSEFLANMSHELRTPLNAINGFSDLIRTEKLGPIGNVKYREYSNDIHTSGQHLLALINDILDLAKVESGEDELREQDIDVAKIVDSVRVMVAERANRNDVELVLAVERDLPMLRADERKLKQILVNLLSNAIKFTPAGGKVTLGYRCSHGGGHVIRIDDTGIGIAPDDIEKAMAPFRQIDGQISRRFEGTGLGLPLTKSLVELHGGTFDLQSELGVGTSAIVRFPADRVVRMTKGQSAAVAS